MHTKTMEGLIGARTNMNMTKVPMRVFKEASRKGDLATMERAMGYVCEFEDKAWQYKAEADEGMKEDTKDTREKEKLAREQAIEKRREERKELEVQREQKKAENVENTVPIAASGNPEDEAVSTVQKADSVEISPEGRALLSQSPSGITASKPDDPVFYSSSRAADKSVHNEAPTVNVSV